MKQHNDLIKIRITEAQHVCHDRKKHHQTYLEELRGMEVMATRYQEDHRVMLVSALEIITALLRADKIRGLTYWHWLWTRTYGFHQPFVFQEGDYIVLRQRKKKPTNHN